MTKNGAVLAQLEREEAEVRALVQEAWDLRVYSAWVLVSAWLLGTRTRIWLLRRGWIS